MGDAPRDRSRSLVRLVLSSRGRVDARTYALVGVALVALKYAVDGAAIWLATGRVWTPLDYLDPLLFHAEDPRVRPEPGLQIALGLWTLPFLWIGATLTIRRAYDAGLSPWVGLLFFVPLVNYAVMLGLCLRPTVRYADDLDLLGESAGGAVRHDASLVLVAVGISVLLIGAAVLASVHVLRSYGTALFVGAPFLLGVLTGVLFNARTSRGVMTTLGLSNVAVLVAACALVLVAAEGVVCILMAIPIALPMALLGALVGRGLAITGRGASHVAPGGAAVLGLVVLGGIEERLGSPAAFRVDTAIEVDAPPAVVWGHVVAFAELPPPSELAFRLGIAYPVRARIDGSGVGAVRRCEFSTGAFVEPITVWDAPRRLAFDVVAQPPPMTEWSPYADLHPPHLDGYLRSTGGEFRLVPLDGGRRTLLEGTTWYALDLHPAGYWRLWSDALIHRIHVRVLRHVAALAEAG